jgi:hypothetical protein
MRACALPIIFLAVLLPLSGARADDEDQRALCPIMSATLAQMVAAKNKGNGQCKAFCRGCGCKGGRGSVAPTGNAWAVGVR